MTTASGSKARGKAPARGGARKRAKATAEPRRSFTWLALTLMVIGIMLALRLGVNALGPVPAGSGEARLWAFGQALDWGFFFDPPLAPAVVRIATDWLGDTLFALRLASPLAHALAAWMVFMTGAHVWDGRTGFWAAAGYTLAPGVSVSAMTASPEVVMTAASAVALYTMVRGLEARGYAWWIICGLAVGLGLQAHYAMACFALAGLVFLSVSREAEKNDWRGFAIACGVGLLVLLPNLVWQAAHGFPALARGAGLFERSGLDPAGGLRGLGAQVALLGPPFFLALIPAAATIGRWRHDWGMRLAMCQFWLMMTAVVLLAPGGGAWAGPAWVAGALAAARWLLGAGWRRWLAAQLAIGATASIVLWTAAGLYAVRGAQLPVALDPFPATRAGPEFCATALRQMAERDAEVLLSTSADRLSECMFRGGLAWQQVAIWNPELRPGNQHELVGTLREGDGRRMILALTADGASIPARFAEATAIGQGEIVTHRGRSAPYRLWLVQGFQGYDAAE